MDDPIEDGVGQGGITDEFVPAIDRKLAGDDQRARVVAIALRLPHMVSWGGSVVRLADGAGRDHRRVGWDLPEVFATLRRLLEARVGKQGKREFVQVLRLMEVFAIEDVAAGVRAAIDRGVIGFDAVKHLVLCRIERRPARLDMTVYPYLPRASVAITSTRTYLDLLSGVAS